MRFFPHGPFFIRVWLLLQIVTVRIARKYKRIRRDGRRELLRGANISWKVFRVVLDRSSLVPDGDIDTLFSTDETCGKTADELFDYGISMFDVFSSIRSFVDRYPYSQQDPHSNVLPPKAPNVPKYTLVLDLDGTVVNCSLKEPSYYDDSFIVRSSQAESHTERNIRWDHTADRAMYGVCTIQTLCVPLFGSHEQILRNHCVYCFDRIVGGWRERWALAMRSIS